MVKDINPSGGSYAYCFTAFNGSLYFQAADGTNGLELWRSDGTETGTQMVKDINPGSADSRPVLFTVFNGNVYFWADDGTTGWELWRTGDFSPPETNIDSGPSGTTTETSATFAFSADEPATFECAHDGDGFTSSALPRRSARSRSAPTPSGCGPSTRPET
jgi:ELWxxDGT repeat protein